MVAAEGRLGEVKKQHARLEKKLQAKGAVRACVCVGVYVFFAFFVFFLSFPSDSPCLCLALPCLAFDAQEIVLLKEALQKKVREVEEARGAFKQK
jgi:hypothetical protein